MKDFKIIFAMQILADEPKKSWYCFEKNHSDHQYTFKNYSNFLLNLVENSMNCQFHFVQLFNDAKQSKKQSIHVFDVYLSSLKVQLSSYMKKQKRIHFFTKLKPSIKIVLTNYQNLSSIKKNLLSLTARLKNNIKMKKKINIINFFIQFNQFANKSGKNEKPNKKNWKKKFNFNKSAKLEKKQQKTKWKNQKKWEKNNSPIVYFHCKKLNHVTWKCSNLKKKKDTLNKNKKKNDVSAINSHVDEDKSIISKPNLIYDDFAFGKNNYVSAIIMLNDETEINVVNQKFIIINDISARQKPLSKPHWINGKKIHCFKTHDFTLCFENSCKQIRVFTTTFYAVDKKKIWCYFKIIWLEAEKNLNKFCKTCVTLWIYKRFLWNYWNQTD